MRSEVGQNEESASCRSFELYLRTGLRVSPEGGESGVAFKFNQNHDPANGQFTFSANAGTPRAGTFKGEGGRFGGAGATGRFDRGPSPFSPEHPKNHTVYVVKRGDSLTRIAASRHGLSVPDLARLNRVTPTNPLHVGQSLMLPKQSYLDAGRAAKNRLIAVTDALRPPGPARAPSDPSWKRITKNGYEFHIDSIERTRLGAGSLKLDPGQGRSRASQSSAGGRDRLTSDQGGHYIGVRFNGPTDRFNHFAQDARFNNGAYKAMENSWDRDLRSGKKVYVHIVPKYKGASQRPSSIEVTYFVNGNRQFMRFKNSSKGN